MAIKNKLSCNFPGRLNPMLRGLMITYLLIILLSLLSGFVFYFSPLNEQWMQPLGVIITAAALFFGGRIAAQTAGNKGMIHGLTIGVTFVIISLLLSLGSDISWSALAMKSVYAVLASIIGGITGVK
ncbi:TIGR04086 family membrane protein [Dehalobacterium formicoaceticum]|uniref:TIGR04086 family membrane protein n=1 Tax=Dehalobacterium formicoaceticum TaxID=51515 RepID=UPI000B7DB9C1|nr:TIGR04086 family membrane protein [Dehalobacterium formicoaceticum]